MGYTVMFVLSHQLLEYRGKMHFDYDYPMDKFVEKHGRDKEHYFVFMIQQHKLMPPPKVMWVSYVLKEDDAKKVIEVMSKHFGKLYSWDGNSKHAMQIRLAETH